MAKRQEKSSNIFTDVSSKEAGMTDEKYKLYESSLESRTDSGFLSGGNLVISGEIHSEEIKSEDLEPLTDSGVGDDSVKTNPSHLGESMRLDSGVDLGLSESFSNLSLKNPNLNDLSSSKIKEPISPVQIKKEVEQPPWELCYAQDEDGDTQLHTAIVQGFLELVVALIRAAPHPRLLDTQNDDAQSPLHLAVMTGQWQIVRWLIVAGAKPCPRNLQGDSPLHICARTGDVQSCKAIAGPVTKHERDVLALSYPIQNYQQCDFEQWNYEGKTCVHIASLHGHIDVLRHLVWYGADINAREGTSGYTALNYALQRRDEQMTHFLLSEKKLNPNVLTYARKSVLQLGYQMPSNLAETLRLRGVPSPYSSDDDYEDDSEDELNYESYYTPQSSSIIHASA